jgi:hypothetical protein
MSMMLNPSDMEMKTLSVDILEEIKKVRAELAEFRKEMRDTLRKFQIGLYNYADTSDAHYLMTWD